MNCKHAETRGNTTKYFYCKLRDKSVDDYSCKNCVMKLPNLPEGFEKLFGGLNGRKYKR